MLLSVVTFKISFFILLLDYAHMQNTNDAISLQNATCLREQFRCDSGQCIDDLKLCDGIADCKDNSDETIKVCSLEQCPDQSFMCEYGACIHINGRCNGNKDCFDWSDEESCPYTKSYDYFGCELPDNPPHGQYAVISHLWIEYHSGDIIPTYAVLSLSCHKGYVINPPEDDGLSYCLPTRELMPVPKTCARKSLFSAGCRLPDNPSNGKYAVINHISAGYKPGDIVPVFSLLVVNCDNGYKGNPLEFHLVSYCLATEEWSPAPNTCTAMPILSEGCQIPNNPSYGRYSIESALKLPSRLQSDLTSGDMVPVHSQLSLDCYKGYKVNPSDDELSDCTSTGEWSPAPKTCVYPDPQCQVPNNPLHGQYVVITHTSNSDVEIPEDFVPLHSILFLRCNKGYEVNLSRDGEPSNCTSARKWVPSPRTCFQGCRLPDNPLHGEYVIKYDETDYNAYHPGDLLPMHKSLSVNCNKGYEVNSSTINEPSYCTSTGKWVPSPKTCFQGCRFLENPLNGKYVLQDYETGDKYRSGDVVPVSSLLFVICNQGYSFKSPTNDDPAICTSTGKWNPAPETCVRSSFANQGCRIPSSPSHGKYIINNNLSSEYNPGDVLPVKSVLSVNCTMGYDENSPDIVNLSRCELTGEWIPAPKTCARACPSLISTNTTNIVCEFNGKPLNTCSNAVENTIARLSCAPFYEESNLEKYPTRLCNDGSWKYPIPQCYPICGKNNFLGVNKNINTYNNRVIFRNWYPWYVNVYQNDHNLGRKKYICRGSIIKEHIVLSAARCFADDQGKKYEIEDFYIIPNENFNNPRDINYTHSRVQAIHIPESFKGIINYYEADIAIIILSAPFQLTPYVQPVCIDLETVHDDKSLDYGIITGLGTVYENHEDELSKMFNKEIFSVLPYNNCSEKVYEESRKYITYDKICLKYLDIDYAIICVRPSGSALAYLKKSTDRYFVRAIASTDINNDGTLCALAYTSIDHHIDFIRKVIKLYSSQDLINN